MTFGHTFGLAQRHCIDFGYFFLCNNKVLNAFAMLQMHIKGTNAFATCKGTALILENSDDL